MSLKDELKKSKEEGEIPQQLLFEKYGITSKFLTRIGVNDPLTKMLGFVEGKNSLKIYIPKRHIDKFQAFSIYLKIVDYSLGKTPSISRWLVSKMLREVDSLILNEDPIMMQSIKLLKDLKTQNFLEDEKRYKEMVKL